MCENKIPTYIDPMAEMIAQIRQEERTGAKIDFVVAMLRGGEPDEKIAKYARLDMETVREARTIYEDLAKTESERKSRAMVFRYGEQAYFGNRLNREKAAKRIREMEISDDSKRHLLQMLGFDS